MKTYLICKHIVTIYLSHLFQVLNTSDSPVSAEVIQMFKKPEPVQIAAIKTKDKGQRVSLKAQVEHVCYKNIQFYAPLKFLKFAT